MRNRSTLLKRSLWMSTALLVFLAAGTGVAGAANTAGATETAGATTDSSFGLLGPVGLVAVVLGIVGMTLGVLRQRRKTQAVEPPPDPSADEVTRPILTPYRQPPL